MAAKTMAEEYQKQYDAAVNDVYRKGDRSKPLLPEGQMEEYLLKLKVRYSSALLEVEKQAKQQKQAADTLEARAKQDPSNHLSDAELQAASLRKPFIEKDAQKLDIQSFCDVAKQEASKGHKASCLAYLETLPESSNIEEQRVIDDTKETLKQVLIPPDLRNAGQRANKMRLDAEIERVGAKSALHELIEPEKPFNPFE